MKRDDSVWLKRFFGVRLSCLQQDSAVKMALRAVAWD